MNIRNSNCARYTDPFHIIRDLKHHSKTKCFVMWQNQLKIPLISSYYSTVSWYTHCYMHCTYINISFIYLYINLAWVSVCLFVSNKRQNGWTNRAHIFCGSSRDPREGLWMIKFKKKLCLKVFCFCKILKCAKKVYEICKVKMLTDKATIKSKNRRWARSALKA